MKSRGVVGRTIASIDQRLVQTNTGPCWTIDRIWLDDGSVICLMVVEMEDDYAIEGSRVAIPRRRKRKDT